MVTIGMDASRANSRTRTGTEWYAYAVLSALRSIIPSTIRVRLYAREPLRDNLAQLPSHWEERVLRWRPGLLWTQLRCSWEMLVHPPDLLYIPTHTIPLLHPRRVLFVAHDLGFLRQGHLYDESSLHSTGDRHPGVGAAVRLLTAGRYRATERDYHRFAMQFALRNATKLIVPSAYTRREIHELYGPQRATITVVPNGYNPVKWNAKLFHDLEKKYRIQRPYFLYVGRIEKKKNINGLLEGFATMRKQSRFPATLLLCGKLGFEGNQMLSSSIASDLGNAIRHTGYISNEELGTLMHYAEAVVLPSFYEGFGIPILEAMSAETLVTCSDIPALREVGGAIPFFFDPSSPSSIAKILISVTRLTPQERSDRIMEGKNHLTQYSWNRTAEETWQVMKSML